MSTKLFDLSGRIALIAGASRGIGAAIARLLAEQGAHVIVTSRKLDGCQLVVDEIRAAGHSAEAMACHIGEMEQIEAAFAQVRATHGRLDILVNNAAANPYFGHVVDTDLPAFQKTLDVNIRGYFYMSAGAIKLMREGGGGAIVNVGSVNGITPGPLQGIYSISKAAIISMTKTFAKECAGENIRVNALLPGLTKTKFAGALFTNEDVHREIMAGIPMGRHAEPGEMAGAVLYLASDAASYTTGICLTVDGGLTI
ncbi:MAG: SDR family oxidoreductase [Gammaproteobacteria bacterium]|nr:SDR family oxidoreductase [Gammaproteobacteria bacterium]MBK9426089.1 SDR family oxidoreductase [Gammaproteobacteria bacterium]